MEMTKEKLNWLLDHYRGDTYFLEWWEPTLLEQELFDEGWADKKYIGASFLKERFRAHAVYRIRISVKGIKILEDKYLKELVEFITTTNEEDIVLLVGRLPVDRLPQFFSSGNEAVRVAAKKRFEKLNGTKR